MEEQQISFDLDVGFSLEPAVAPVLRDEIAEAWGLPLGRRIEVCFLGSQHAAVTGTLELLTTPDFPWEPRQPLRLHIAGLEFWSREIERWTLL